MYVLKGGLEAPQKGPKGPLWEFKGCPDFLVLKIIYNFYTPCKNIIDL